jgi:ABC-type branched-subunit amino acid transport system ATPase component
MDAADVGELDSLLANLAAGGGAVGGACPQIVDKLRHTIVGLKNEGLSMILNSSLALDVADDVALLDTTRITLEGAAKELRNRRAFSDEQVGG